METRRESVQEVLLMIKAEMYKFGFIQGFLIFGSYARGDDFKDLDIVGVVGGFAANREELKKLAKNDVNYFDNILHKYSDYLGFEIQNQGYLGITHKGHFIERDLDEELNQLEEQIRGFYEHYKKFNRLPQSTRREYGIDKMPEDFRFSPNQEHIIWRKESYYRNDIHRPYKELLKEGAISVIVGKLNKEYEEEVRSYSSLAI